MWVASCASNTLLNLLFQRWARVYRDDEYHCAVNTNNGVEAQNRLLKHTYLSRHKNLTLSSLMCILIEHFLPEMYEKYVTAQFKMTGSYRQYYSWVPDFLHNRPRTVIAHSLQRIQNCEKEKYKESDIQMLSEENGQFAVKSKSGRVCTLQFGNCSVPPSCSCEDWTKYHLPCKHFFAVFCFKAEWTWDRLPKNYLNSPRLSCDIDVLELKDEGEVGPASEHINPHCQLPHPIFEQISDELTSNELQSDSELIDSSSDTSIEVSFFVYW